MNQYEVQIYEIHKFDLDFKSSTIEIGFQDKLRDRSRLEWQTLLQATCAAFSPIPHVE